MEIENPVVHLVFNPPSGAKVDLSALNYDVITHEIVTHAILVSIRSDALLIGIIRADRKSVVVDGMRVL